MLQLELRQEAEVVWGTIVARQIEAPGEFQVRPITAGVVFAGGTHAMYKRVTVL
jgi:hypothetical protein